MANNNQNNMNAAIGAAVGTVGAIVLAPVLLPAALGIFGFGASGIVGGSIAAGIQAGIGSVTAGSLFAVAQGIGAGGAIPAAAYAAAGAMGAAAGANAAAGAGGPGPGGPGAGPGGGGGPGAGPGGGGPGVGPGGGGGGGGPGTGPGGAGAGAGAGPGGGPRGPRNADVPRLGNTSPPNYEESCYICGSEQHDGDHCPETTNGFLTQGHDGWRGPNNEEVCIEFNARSGCRNSRCTSPHICSRCGGNRHNAQNH